MLTPTKLQLEPIVLAGGWSGTVVTGCDAPRHGDRSPLFPPSTAVWASLLEAVVGDPSVLPEYEILKFSNAREVFKIRLNWEDRSLDVVCKRNRTAGALDPLLDRVRGSRERRQFEMGLALCRAGIGTATPLAVLECGGTPRTAWVITQFLADIVDLDQLALTILPKLSGVHARRVKDTVIDCTADLFARLQTLKLHHRDLKATNIVLTDWEGTAAGPSAWLLDLEGFRWTLPVAGGRRWQTLVRLAASLLSYESITRTDYLRFLRAYMNRIGLPTNDWKAHFTDLGRRAVDYNRKALRRKSHTFDGFPAGK